MAAPVSCGGRVPVPPYSVSSLGSSMGGYRLRLRCHGRSAGPPPGWFEPVSRSGFVRSCSFLGSAVSALRRRGLGTRRERVNRHAQPKDGLRCQIPRLLSAWNNIHIPDDMPVSRHLRNYVAGRACGIDGYRGAGMRADPCDVIALLWGAVFGLEERLANAQRCVDTAGD